jgi:hypothetical protein
VPDRLLNKSPEKTEFSTNLILGDGYANYHQNRCTSSSIERTECAAQYWVILFVCHRRVVPGHPSAPLRQLGLIVPRRRGTYISHPPYIRRQRRSVRRFATERHRGCAWWRLHGQLGA